MTFRTSGYIVGLALAFYACLCFLYSPFAADDAYIVGRYALNAVDGHGLVYNPGEYISALTSPLHALALVAIAQVHDDPVAMYRILSPCVPVLSAILAYFIYRPTLREVAVIALFALASPFLALWSVGGLETPLLTAWLMMFVAYFFKIYRSDRIESSDLFAVGVLAALAFLTRFDSVLITMPLLISLVFVAWNRWQLWAAGAVSAVIAFSWLVYAYLTYGDIWPTSVHIKLVAQGGGGLESVSALLNFVLISGALLVLIFAWGRRGSAVEGDPPLLSSPQKAITRGALISGALFAGYCAEAAGVHMMFGYRMFVPLLFPLAMIIAAYTQHRALAHLACLAVLQTAMAATVLTVGMNVRLIDNFGPLGRAEGEMRQTTPEAYGRFMANLRNDAEGLNRHWAEQQIDRDPAILLFTGGSGYWLRDFYVFEELVSFRKVCDSTLLSLIQASDYIQTIDHLRVNSTVQDSLALANPEAVSLTLSENTTVIYKFSLASTAYRLPSRVDGACE